MGKILSLQAAIELGKLEDFETAIGNFSCRDKDVEGFLKTKALTNERRHKSRTYLVVETDEIGAVCSPLKILAYFTLAFKVLDFTQTVSKTSVKEIDGFNKNANNAAVLLIGQLGKDEIFGAAISGAHLLNGCFTLLKQSQEIVGGRVVLLECRPIEKLVKFYEEYGFKHLQTDPNDTYLQLFRQL